MRHPLGELIESVIEANDLSYDKVVARARAEGYKLSRSTIGAIVNEPPKRLPIDTYRAVAAGLRVPVGMVVRAAAASAGVDMNAPSSPTPEQAVRSDTLLSERDKQAILALIATMRQPAEQRRHAQ